MIYANLESLEPILRALMLGGLILLVAMPVLIGVAYRSLKWAGALFVALIAALFLIGNAAALDPDWCQDTGCCWYFERHWVDENTRTVYFVPADDIDPTDGSCQVFGECMLDLTEQGYTVQKIGDRWAPSAKWPITYEWAQELAGLTEIQATYGDNAEWSSHE